MKKTITLIAAALVCTLASAQFVGSTSGSPSTPKASRSFGNDNESDAPSSFGSLSFQYNPLTFKMSYKGDSETEKANGVSLLYTNANRLAQFPLYIEYGIGMQYSFKTQKDDSSYGSIKSSLNMLSFKVPVELLYKLNFGKGFAFAPYVGLDAVVYALGKTKTTVSSRSGSTEEYEEDFFGDDYSRFNLDWHIGAKLFYKRFFFAAAYEGPIVGFYNKDDYKFNLHQANISVGFTF